MKKKLGMFVLLVSTFLLAGCFGNMSPSERVEEMLNKYIRNDDEIMEELDTYINKQDLSDSQKSTYKEIIKNEYSTIKYTIEDETIEEDKATVKVNITVKDLYKASKESEEHLKEAPQEFYTDGTYDASKFIDYKLSVMKESTDTVSYTVSVNLTRTDGIWSIEELSNEDLEKIHGIYDYSEESLA